ncbi:hypothetical protein VE00_10772 [Pseudogymnoascus sp. WSF 3629]|nr:hypothetical protein VE00_10772 [Pseudogymnoascus sp. WSF 3629]
MENIAAQIPTKWTIPFRADEELNSELQLINDEKKSIPQLCRTHPGRPTTLPGNTFVGLELDSIWAHLQATLLTAKLDAFAPHLWLISTQSSSSISPLHKQRVLGREIIISDSADLHLVWYYSKIFLKPLPRYLLCHAFWKFVFDERHGQDMANQLHPASIGFVRSYCYLIQSETDFHLAQNHGLVPEGVEFEAFSRFIKCFKDLPDTQASPRFHFGELRLTRLNFWSIIFLRQRHYFNMSRQYGTYFSRFFQPLLFVFGMLSLLLSAMQVALAAEAVPSVDSWWNKFISVFKWTSIAIIFILLLTVVWLLAVLAFKLLSELAFALRSMLKKRFAARKDVV